MRHSVKLSVDEINTIVHALNFYNIYLRDGKLLKVPESVVFKDLRNYYFACYKLEYFLLQYTK